MWDRPNSDDIDCWFRDVARKSDTRTLSFILSCIWVIVSGSVVVLISNSARLGDRYGRRDLHPCWVSHPSFPVYNVFDLPAQRQGLYRSIRRPEGANWTHAHICSSISASSTFSSYRSSISPASRSEPQRICLYTSVLEFLRDSWRRELYSYSFAARGHGNSFMDRACVHDLAPSEYQFFSWFSRGIHNIYVKEVAEI